MSLPWKQDQQCIKILSTSSQLVVMIERLKGHYLVPVTLLIVIVQSWHALSEVHKRPGFSIRGFFQNRVRPEKDWEQTTGERLPS